MRREGIGQAERRRRAARRRCSIPESTAARRCPPPARPARAGRADRREKGLQFEHVLRKVIGRSRGCGAAPGPSRWSVPGARPRPRSIRPGNSRASVPNCSAMMIGAWFGSMMPPAPTRMRRGARGDVGDHDRGRGAGDAGHVVMLGHPEAAIAPALGVGCEIAGVVERAARIGRLGDADEIENGQGRHRELSG